MRKLVRSRLKWAGHVERMEGVRLTKRADALRVESRQGCLCEERFSGRGGENEGEG